MTSSPCAAAAGPRHAVFLQGMPSPFFSRIAERLRAHGWRTTRINLCIGDRLFWRGGDVVDYRGTPGHWPAFLDDFFAAQGVTDLLLLGEQRRYHREAVGLAHGRGIRVTVTDFGYLRPDWITFERDGMSGGSRFPRDPAAIRALAARCPQPDWARRYTEGAVRMARADLGYNLANLLLGWLHPHYRRSDMRPPTLVYTPASAWRLWTNARVRPRMEAFVQGLIASGRRYYVFPLQLDFDFQIVAYSPFSSIEESIDLVVASFARHAPADAELVLKEHPWDPALHDWAHAMQARAREHGVESRVHYLRGGNLDELIRGSDGVVTVNSTSGLRALQLGCPVQVLGQAVYDIAGLTFAGGIDAFWTQAAPPDPQLLADALRALAGTVQIRGAFFHDDGLDCAVTEAVQRLLHDRVGAPLGDA
ncbi:capsule polysaccharide biosynthesis protein [Burkholderiales bacterium GJ-E10]|nr:capsule polysaccharide biosynthesis protein [Burkholderiales bacterium GJ-E10]